MKRHKLNEAAIMAAVEKSMAHKAKYFFCSTKILIAPFAPVAVGAVGILFLSNYQFDNFHFSQQNVFFCLRSTITNKLNFGIYQADTI
ncbi:hypothetical protein CDA63_09915 [Hymenobacter amundsenii]|uniref:Uncharacterized protein n=1 Tax=Hymenobacter amundsenii TaxID=2006685 RepID=A0A2D0AG40_9BACT|nr:hypothetical protein CDA63_09915 [Hymenobacter amundsenii]